MKKETAYTLKKVIHSEDMSQTPLDRAGSKGRQTRERVGSLAYCRRLGSSSMPDNRPMPKRTIRYRTRAQCDAVA
jgi:hypothetical protein